MDLISEDAGRARTRALLHGGEYWVVPWFGENAGRLSQAIEERYYGGDRADDCELFMGPAPAPLARAGLPLFSVMFFRKRAMDAGQLADLLREALAVEVPRDDLVAAFRAHDVLLPDPAAARLAPLWLDWLALGQEPPP